MSRSASSMTLVREAVRRQWDQELTQRSHNAATFARAASLVMLACGMLSSSFKTFLKPLLAKPEIAATEVAKEPEKPASSCAVAVTPADTEIERLALGGQRRSSLRMCRQMPVLVTPAIAEALQLQRCR